MIDTNELVARLEKVEKQNRRMKTVGGAAHPSPPVGGGEGRKIMCVYHNKMNRYRKSRK